MRFYLLFLVVALFPPMSYAADSVDGEKSKDQIALEENRSLLSMCRVAAKIHEDDSADDVHYKPGVDVHGNKVVPADFGTEYPLAFPMLIPLEINLLERFDLDVPIGIISDPYVAGVQIFEDGRITYNGAEITNKVDAFCVDKELPPEQKEEGSSKDSKHH